MKKIKLLILFLMMIVWITAYSQDTIRHINSSCIKSDLRNTTLTKYIVTLVSDSVIITWRIEANCASRKAGIIRKVTDTISIKIIETSDVAATCLCNFDLRIGIKASSSDTIIQIDNELLNISYLFNGIQTVVKDDYSTDVYYDSDSECLRVKTKTDDKLKFMQLFDDIGRLQLSISNDKRIIDMCGFAPGIYVLRLLFADNRQIIRKIEKK